MRRPGVVLAYGRDAADVAIFNQFGPMLSPRNMLVFVEAIDTTSIQAAILQS